MASRLRLLFVIPILFLASFPVLVPPSVHASPTIVPNVGIWNDACLSANMTVANPLCAQNGISLDPGTQLTVDVNVTNAPSFNGFEFALYFDPSNLTLSNVKFDKASGAMFDNPYVAQNDNSTPGVIHLGVVNIGTFASGSGVLAFLTFNIKGIGASPFVLGAGTCCPAQDPMGTDWTRLVSASHAIGVTTTDGYLQNNSEGKLGPVARFVFSPMSPTLGVPVTFDASESFDPDIVAPGVYITYSWDFGDGVVMDHIGNSVTTHIFQYSYSSPVIGNFSVRLTVQDQDNHFEGMVTHLVEVSPTPPICPLGLQNVQVPQDCPTIQSAIDSVVRGGTVSVSNGTYKENPVIEKSLKLIGAGSDLTNLEGGITIAANNVTISGFRILNTEKIAGIFLEGKNVVVSDNLVIGQPTPKPFLPLRGLAVSSSMNVTLSRNSVFNETAGVFIDDSPGSLLRSNILANNTYNFRVSGSYIQNIDQSNLVDGRPIFYEIGTSSTQIPPNMGYIGIVNSHDIQLGPTTVMHEAQGFVVVNSTRIAIRGLAVDNVLTGGDILNSTAFTIENSMAQGCSEALFIHFTENSTIRNNAFTCNSALDIENSSNNTITENTITIPGPLFTSGINLFQSSQNQLTNNQIIETQLGSERGAPSLGLFGSSENQIVNNKIMGGMLIENSPLNLFKDNEISMGLENIGVDSAYIECIFHPVPCNRLTDYVQEMDPSNTVDGKPVYYLVDQSNATVPTDAGYVAAINSTNIRIKNVSISYDEQDVLIISSSNISVENSNLTWAFRDAIIARQTNGLAVKDNNFLAANDGIRVESSADAMISGNTMLGLLFSGATVFNSTGVTIQGNYIKGYGFSGIDFASSFQLGPSLGAIIDRNTLVAYSPRLSYGIIAPPNSLITGNTIVQNYFGLSAGTNDTIYHNNFIDNGIQAMGHADTWSNAAGEGNYWTDYTGQDLNGDGIGDTLLPHLGLDNYPLMSPWTPNGLAAKLGGRAAWPEFKRFTASKTNGIPQTLNAQAVNIGTAPEWVDAVFNVTSLDGTVSQVVSQQAWLQPGAKTVLTVNLSPSPGSYKVTVVLRYSSDAYLKWNNGPTKTFSFSAT